MNDELQQAQKDVIASEFDGFIKRMRDHPTMHYLSSQSHEEGNKI